MLENIPKYLIGGDLAGDLTEIMHGLAYVLGKEIA
jgi:hypothetical protein